MVKEVKKMEISIGWDVGGWSGKNHGLCILEASESEIKLNRASSINVYDVKSTIQKVLAKYHQVAKITIAIDAPLQFPELFKQLVSKEQSIFFDQIKLMKNRNPLAWRTTDLFIKQKFGKTPLSASFSFLTSNATVAIALIGEIKASFPQISVMPFDEMSDIRIIEVYPGLLKSKILKHSDAFSKYKTIIQSKLFEKIDGFNYYFGDEKEKTDTADAIICAIYGLGISCNNHSIPQLEVGIPSKLKKTVKSEGWIYYPA